MADDAGTKQDKPSAEEGKGPAPKVAADAKAAKATKPAEGQGEAAPRKRAPRKPKTPKAEGTAAEETGVGKEAAEAAEKAPSGQKSEPAARTRARDKAEKAKAESASDDDAPKPRRGRARKPAAAEKPASPAPTRRRGATEPGGARPVVSAHAKYVRSSARKARLVCDHIRGKSVEEAFAILAHTQRAVAEDWRKLLQSAVANAEHNHELLGDDLRIVSVHADEGPTLKRFRPRAQGRATSIRKRTSHLSISLTPKE